jgi:O-antigen ligase
MRAGLTSPRLGTLPQIPPGAIAAVTVLAAIACGRFFADGHMKYAAALVLVTIYAPLVFFDLPTALALWTAVLFFHDIKALSVAPNSMGVLVGLGFIGALITRPRALPVLTQHRRLIIATVLFCIWMTLSAAWAQQPGLAASQAGFYWLAALAFLIVMTTVNRPRDIKIIALAFVGGAAVAAVIGLASRGLDAANANQVGQTAINGRLTGGGGDPNLQAAGFVAAMFLAMGLMTVYRRRAARIGLIAAFALITVAFFATESRGGLLSLIVTTIAAFLLFPDQRRRFLGLVLIASAIAAIFIASNPGSFSRITDFGGGTSGRSDIWTVATKVFAQHPLAGVGLNNFEVVEPRFALLHRNVSRVTYIAEKPDPAHNSYLQLLADTGVIGLLGFLVIVLASLRATWLAARVFERKGQRDYAHLSRAALMGTVGMLTAIFFITDGDDWRLWLLLGLGPALLAMAGRTPDLNRARSTGQDAGAEQSVIGRRQ